MVNVNDILKQLDASEKKMAADCLSTLSRIGFFTLMSNSVRVGLIDSWEGDPEKLAKKIIAAKQECQIYESLDQEAQVLMQKENEDE